VRVVFDSNVYVSALAIPGGVADEAMHAAREGVFQLVLSRPILVEVLGVLSRKFAQEPEELARTAVLLSSLGEIVSPAQRVHVLADDPDNRVLECAFAARADLVVTGDRQILSLRAWEGIEILSLRQFVDRLGQGREVRQSQAQYPASTRPNAKLAAALERYRNWSRQAS
jgi:putative PIN family toxin of toxin-antitoxin system